MTHEHEEGTCKSVSLLRALAAPAVVFGLMVGCASEQPAPKPAAGSGASVERSRSGPASLSTIRSELLETKTQLRATVDALHALQTSPAGGEAAGYNAFTEAYGKLKARSDATAARVVDLKEQTSNYHASWDREVGLVDSGLRREAERRRADAERIYGTINRELELTRNAFPPLMARLNEIRISLKGNLIPARLNSISDEVAKVDAGAREVDSHAAAILAAIDEIVAAGGKGAVPGGGADAAR